jgi:ferredoxin-NADP reductase
LLIATLDMRLIAIRYVARDTHLFEFAPLHGGPLPAAEPGAHIDIHLANGIVRSYSLTTPDSEPRSYTVGVKRDARSRGGSKYVFDAMKVGQTLKISEPRNNFELVENAGHVVLIAGGIGITPIWSMTQRLASLGRSFELHYSCRSRADMAFLDELQGMKRVHLHFDDESSGQFLDLGTIVAAAPKASHFYCCGPAPMLGAFESVTKGLPPEQVHVEYFTPREEKSLAGGFVVQLARSGREFAIPPGKSILEVLRAAGLELSYSCEEGVCGACETPLISGIPDHRDSVLNATERSANKVIMICCSGCKGDKLVLDL